MTVIDKLVHVLAKSDTRRQMGMSRREYKAFIDECHNSPPWDPWSEPGTHSSNVTHHETLMFP